MLDMKKSQKWDKEMEASMSNDDDYEDAKAKRIGALAQIQCMKATKVLDENGINMKGLMGCPKDAHYRNNDCLGNLVACHCNVYNGYNGGRK